MKDQQRVKFGKHVAGLRKAQRMTQQQVAEMAGLKFVTVKNVEAGDFNVPLDVLCRIAVVLGGELQIIIKED